MLLAATSGRSPACHPAGMREKERRRDKRRHKAGKDHATWDLGNGVVQATPEAVLRAMGGLPPDLDWDVMAPNVIPILPRRRPMPPMAGEPFRVTLPPGIPTGFGIDIGPAFLVVGSSLRETWPIGPAELVATALDNLRVRVHAVRCPPSAWLEHVNARHSAAPELHMNCGIELICPRCGRARGREKGDDAGVARDAGLPLARVSPY